MNEQKAGTVAIVGRPNVGKSTLLNRLIGEKISIVSRKAQTTRHRIMGILTQPGAQYLFVDTPGFQTKYTNALNRTMNRVVTQALADVDVVVLVVDAERLDVEDKTVFNLLIHDCPVILAVNKIDQIKDRVRLLPLIAKLAEQHSFAAVVPVSAARGSQLDVLLTEIRKLLPCRALFFDENEITDKNERFFAAEFIREQLFRLTGDELPYAATVKIEQFELTESLRRIHAVIVVDRSSHKAIVIGRQGETLKRIASAARVEMERLFDGKVFLEVFVQVKSGWNDDEQLLKGLGYE